MDLPTTLFSATTQSIKDIQKEFDVDVERFYDTDNEDIILEGDKSE